MWLKQLRMRRRIYDDLAEEIRQHLAEKAEALMAEGLSREEADRAARREFGNVTRMEERGREPWMYPFIEGLWGDFHVCHAAAQEEFRLCGHRNPDACVGNRRTDCCL